MASAPTSASPQTQNTLAMPLWPARRATNRTKTTKMIAAAAALNSLSANVPGGISKPDNRWPKPNILTHAMVCTPFGDQYAAASPARPPGKKQAPEHAHRHISRNRSEERRVGKEC